MSDFNDSNYRKLAVSVIMQAVQDYKRHPEQRQSIELWLSLGNPWTDLILPEMSGDELIRSLRKYANE